MIESKRLTLRKIEWSDEATLASFLKDPAVMYAWEHGFSDEEVKSWIERNLGRYESDGIGFLLAEQKDTGEVLGAMGLIYNRDLDGHSRWELGYILKKEFWGQGYAKEGAAALIAYGMDTLGQSEIYAQMRTNNLASEAVAKSLGMEYAGVYDRQYCGTIQPHAIYMKRRAAD